MSQLKMYLYLQPSECEESFNGFTYRSYNGTQADRDAWLEICKTGKLLDYEENAFERYITSQEGYRQDLTFFVLDGEKPIATITVLDKQKRIAVLDREEMLGYVHMVGVHSDYCGRGFFERSSECEDFNGDKITTIFLSLFCDCFIFGNIHNKLRQYSNR